MWSQVIFVLDRGHGHPTRKGDLGSEPQFVSLQVDVFEIISALSFITAVLQFIYSNLIAVLTKIKNVFV